MLHATAGQILVNHALPEDMRDHTRVFDKKGTNDVLRELAQKHPEKYVEVSKRLNDIGRSVATEFGGYTFGLEHLRKSAAGQRYTDEIRKNLKKVLDSDDYTPQQRNDLIVKLAGRVQQRQIDDIYDEAVKADNPLALQVLSGSRGNKMNLASLLGSDVLYSDHRDQVIPLPVTSSYSQGLKPVEYWASTYGARRGTMATKFATQDAGFLSKQLNQVAHRLMVVDEDDPRPDGQDRGLPVDTDDPDNEGALLARDVGPYKRDTVLSPKMLKQLKAAGHARILVRSPLVGGSPDGGVYARDVGIRERGVLPGRGEQVGLTAAQALSEPLSQGQLSAKHSGGVAGQEKAVGGFAYINQLIQVPKSGKGWATHAEHDGSVTGVEPAPAGGHFVYVDGKKHYVASGLDLKVKKGDQVEAGDVVSDGFPNPSTVTKYKGNGEGKRYFTNTFVSAMRDAGMKVNRRNVELLSRGLINHVRLTDEFGDYVPDDTVPYSTMEHAYKPRDGHALVEPGRAAGKYLERPVLHYSIGTKVRPSVLKELNHFGIKEVAVHDDPPPFEPQMVRGMDSLKHDPDWMTQMYGSGLKGSLTDSTHRGATSDEEGTSFVPALARAVEFGRMGTVRQPEPGTAPPPEGVAMAPVKRPKPFEPLKLPAAPKAPEPPKPKPGLFSGLFKTSAELEAEAAYLVKAAVGPNMGSSTTDSTGKTTNLAGQAAHPPGAPPPKVPAVGGPPSPHVPGPAPEPAPVGGPIKPPVPPQPAYPAIPPAPAGEVNPARLRSFWGQGGPNNAGDDRYGPGKGVMGPNDDPHSAASFVSGGGNAQDPNSGFGGFAGGVTRFGSLFNTDAVNTLTSGSAYANRGRAGDGTRDDLMGGDGGGWTAGGPGAAQAPEKGWLERAGDALGLTTPWHERTLGQSATAIPATLAGNVALGKGVQLAGQGARALVGAGAAGGAGAGGAAAGAAASKGLFSRLAGAAKGGLGVGVGIDALAAGPAAMENYAALAMGQPYLPERVQEMNELARQHQNANPVEGAFRGATAPIHTIQAGVASVGDVIDARAEGDQASWKFNKMDAKNTGEMRQRMQAFEEYKAALAAGHPAAVPWTKPGTTMQFNQGGMKGYEADAANWRKYLESNPVARETAGQGFADRTLHDVTSRSLVNPFTQPAGIPGTNRAVEFDPSLEGLGNFFRGRWTTQRTD